MKVRIILLSLILCSASALCAEPPRPAIFALVVANNQGLEVGRPPLQYADDDAARYYDIFASLTSPERIALLTEFDRDTSRLVPSLVARARPPTYANLQSEVEKLSAAIAAEKRTGRPVEFYFVFAGHGDVDHGRGFLELKDAALHAEELEGLLLRIGATRTNVFLDSCNSFFVLNPRKPGGRRFSTPEDAAANLSKRLPNVGVFLSTSAEAETFEWSELQSGIFSYAVRSGLMGAADANGDGRITYRELAAFVETVTAEVRNPAYRPKVFARGPAGDGDASLIDWRSTGAAILTLDAPEPMRIALKNAEGIRVLDAHKEAGATLRLYLPAQSVRSLTLERLEGPEERPHVVQRYHLDRSPSAGSGLALAAAGSAEAPKSRGPADIFRILFANPFGPKALKAYEARVAELPPPVYGISTQDVERMKLLLGRLASVQREQRLASLGLTAGIGASFAVFGLLTLADKQGDPQTGHETLIVGGGFAALGLAFMFKSSGEELEEKFRMGFEHHESPEALVVQADAALEQMYRVERRKRLLSEAGGLVALSLGAMLLMHNEYAPGVPTHSGFGRVAGPLALGIGTLGIVEGTLLKSPTESILELWRQDPARPRVTGVALGPIDHGLGIAVTGRF